MPGLPDAGLHDADQQEGEQAQQNVGADAVPEPVVARAQVDGLLEVVPGLLDGDELLVSWNDDADRSAWAGVPSGTGSATKPAPAGQMVTDEVQAGVPPSWVAGEEVYGVHQRLRALIRGHRLGYVLQISANWWVPTHAGPIPGAPAGCPADRRRLAAPFGRCGEHALTGLLLDLVALTPETRRGEEAGGEHHVLARRNDTTGELACHLRWCPTSVPLAALVPVAGQRWRTKKPTLGLFTIATTTPTKHEPDKPTTDDVKDDDHEPQLSDSLTPPWPSGRET